MAEWTRARVEERLESAADVMRALPDAKPQGYFSAWPEYFHTFRQGRPGGRDAAASARSAGHHRG